MPGAGGWNLTGLAQSAFVRRSRDALHIIFGGQLRILTLCCESFNVKKPCPHPSLEGRGSVVVVVAIQHLSPEFSGMRLVQLEETPNEWLTHLLRIFKAVVMNEDERQSKIEG